MVKILSGSLILLLLASGCASTGSKPIEIYTFQKDRVDQKIDGNRGYLSGVSTEKVAEHSKTRTLIGIDIEIPGGYAENEKEEASIVQQTVIREEVPEKSQQAVVEVTEEDWIK